MVDVNKLRAKPVALTIAGPTAIGKTELAMALAEIWPVRLISVDSAMIYRGMDVGTAKPTPVELARFPHDLVDILDPAERYSVADFVQQACASVRKALDSQQIPVFVGGTMMYFKALRDGLADLPSTDPELLQALEAELDERGAQDMHTELSQIDPQAASVIAATNRQRLLRALAVYRSSGVPISQYWQQQQADDSPGPLAAMGVEMLEYALVPDSREELYRRINVRFDRMCEAGFVAEVEALYERGDLNVQMPSIRCVGYRQLWAHLDGQTSLSDAGAAATQATRHLAKRQLTWLRGWHNAGLVEPLVGADEPRTLIPRLVRSCNVRGLKP